MNFKFGKKIINKQNNIYKNENKDLDDKLDNIYESIQNIVFNEPKINKLNQNKIKFNFEPNINLLQKEKNMIKKINKDEILIKNKKDNESNISYNERNNNKKENNDDIIDLKLENNLEKNNKIINDNLLKKENNFEDNFSFRNNKLNSIDKKSENNDKNSSQEIINLCKIIKYIRKSKSFD